MSPFKDFMKMLRHMVVGMLILSFTLLIFTGSVAYSNNEYGLGAALGVALAFSTCIVLLGMYVRKKNLNVTASLEEARRSDMSPNNDDQVKTVRWECPDCGYPGNKFKLNSAGHLISEADKEGNPIAAGEAVKCKNCSSVSSYSEVNMLDVY